MCNLILLLLLAGGGSLGIPLPVTGAETGYIRVMDLTMRSGPGKQTRPIKTLERGAVVAVLGRQNGWLKIHHDGHTGYILNEPTYVRLLAEAAEDVSTAQPPQRKKAIEDRIKSSEAELAALRDRETALSDAVDQAERRSNRKRRQVMATEAALSALENRIDTEQTQLTDLASRIRSNSVYAGQRIRALHQLNTLGTLPVLATSESWMDFLKRRAALARILADDRETLDALVASRQQQAALLQQLNERRSEQQRLEENLRQELAVLTAHLAERSEMLSRIKSEETLQEALIRGLQASAKELDAAIGQLAVPAARETEADPTSTAATLKPATAMAAPPPETASPPFIKLKGLLNLPVSGKIVSSYGPYRNAEFNVMNFRSGVLIRADRGEPIHAVANGKTLFADWFKGYGNMLIIDHGDHYYTVYAHLEALFKARGEAVDADEVIATVGDTATLVGPGLHFEVRHHGKPMDPLPWLRSTDSAASDRKKGVDG